eukprot:CAMPEP_0113301686 /NCGR_PEP_ID=MMETSP0010_2-20120614/2808_1 /TAXON_ID=216773 ORGANISM="Corethron hystrix, Strain 308" /NCGR_SAMPLE_ID=MMETSP0010_2 /ASSEMBLY_ACC=CAM_ASM_000155 /LENGTH=361 /DNA_ID=CAMNT_0000155343 /DNA_START=75 /DNA_END=1160 /DNA_ORIENTATION=- /assembly_acc=CAM_ASM_000155
MATCMAKHAAALRPSAAAGTDPSSPSSSSTIAQLARAGYDSTSAVIDHNLAHYSAWSYRRECIYDMIRHENEDDDCTSAARRHVALEREFIRKTGGTNPKNYQLWFHRRTLLACIYGETVGADVDGDGRMTKETSWDRSYNFDEETSFADGVISEHDTKNYHAWSHRQWAAQRYVTNDEEWKKIVQKELLYCENMIRLDRRNNSAWNHRWFIFHLCPAAADGNKPEKCKIKLMDYDQFLSETDFVIQHIEADHHNESPWVYLTEFVLEWNGYANDLVDNKSAINDILSRITDLSFCDSADIGGGSVPGLTAVINLLETKRDDASLLQAIDLVDQLISGRDRIRAKYWLHRRDKLRKRVDKK